MVRPSAFAVLRLTTHSHLLEIFKCVLDFTFSARVQYMQLQTQRASSRLKVIWSFSYHFVRRTLLREYDKWAKDHPEDVTKRGGVVFFTYLQKERLDLLDFHAVGGDKWATVHGWLYYTGWVKD